MTPTLRKNIAANITVAELANDADNPRRELRNLLWAANGITQLLQSSQHLPAVDRMVYSIELKKLSTKIHDLIVSEVGL